MTRTSLLVEELRKADGQMKQVEEQNTFFLFTPLQVSCTFPFYYFVLKFARMPLIHIVIVAVAPFLYPVFQPPFLVL